jgi:hypothetical protein
MSEVTYNASKTIFGMFGAFVKDVADEIGWEKTMEIFSKIGARDGEQLAGFFKTHAEETRMEERGKIQAGFYNVSGWKMDYETTPTSLEFTIHTCPLFDGFLENGLEVEKINALCKSMHKEYDKALKRAFPGAEFTSIAKPSKDGDCIEKITIPLSNI